VRTGRARRQAEHEPPETPKVGACTLAPFIGVLQLFAAFSIFSGGSSAAGSESSAPGLGAIGALLSIPGYPFWSLCVFLVDILDILVIYGLVAYGGHQHATPDTPTARGAM
jgi:hypothetical protein